MNRSRRDFIKTSSILGGGFILSFNIPSGILNKYRAEEAVNFNGFLSIRPDNIIEIHISKIEMGQGIWTTLPMLIAEELDCDLGKVKISHRVQGKNTYSSEGMYQLSTGGSDTTRSEFDRYRMIGATARTMLVQAAAKKLQVLPEACTTANGHVISGKRSLSYGELANAAALEKAADVKLRSPDKWRYIGKDHKRLDAGMKVNGSAKYGMDMQFPGMLTAVIAYPPQFGGKVISFDSSEALKVKGVKSVIQIPNGIAVIADTFWNAKNGREQLKINWTDGSDAILNSDEQLKTYRDLSKTSGKISQHKGDVIGSFQTAVETIEAEYVFPYLAHAPMEPLNCTVNLDKDSCEVWTGTQGPAMRQQEIAKYLGIPPEKVIINTPLLGGSFGRRGSFGADWVMDAVHIAQISGQLIKLVWSREDDIKGGHYRPFYFHSLKIGLDQNGLPVSWLHRIVGQSLFTGTFLEKDLISNGVDYSSVDGVNGSPYLDYTPHNQVELHTTANAVPVLSWRSVGNSHTAFVMETIVDELASRADKDPIDYRMLMLKKQPRHLAVLDELVLRSGWKNKIAEGMFRGMAIHKAMGSTVAQAVEISINKDQIRVHKVTCVIDCGLAVNPDGVKAQMESGIVFGLTAALYGEITFENGEVNQSNFHDYKMLRMNEMPAIEICILPAVGKMSGAGEPGVPPIAPAVANAVFAATGKRIRSLPIRIT